MPINNSLGLVAALALASHAPERKPKKVLNNDKRIVQSPESSPSLPGKGFPSFSNSHSNSLSSESTNSSSSTDTCNDTFTELLNDPIFSQAVEHVKRALNSESNTGAKAASLVMSDPKVQMAMRQARLTMQNPQIQAMVNSNVKRMSRLKRTGSFGGENLTKDEKDDSDLLYRSLSWRKSQSLNRSSRSSI